MTFAAYGQLLAVHGTTGAALPATAALTSLGYSGEHFDARAQQQYLRARWYNPANGQFNRLDPFAGNMQDPQSLHKYAYVHGDPVQGVDPTGKFLVSMVVSFGISSQLRKADAQKNAGAWHTFLRLAHLSDLLIHWSNTAHLFTSRYSSGPRSETTYMSRVCDQM
ncbi:MAG TPA: hypothetical protein DDZ51_04320 [Planctomycetaceae bacterium]|nr:hypothetical protein [Planctomycetaceae bacterium]